MESDVSKILDLELIDLCLCNYVLWYDTLNSFTYCLEIVSVYSHEMRLCWNLNVLTIMIHVSGFISFWDFLRAASIWVISQSLKTPFWSERMFLKIISSILKTSNFGDDLAYMSLLLHWHSPFWFLYRRNQMLMRILKQNKLPIFQVMNWNTVSLYLFPFKCFRCWYNLTADGATQELWWYKGIFL